MGADDNHVGSLAPGGFDDLIVGGASEQKAFGLDIRSPQAAQEFVNGGLGFPPGCVLQLEVELRTAKFFSRGIRYRLEHMDDQQLGAVLARQVDRLVERARTPWKNR